MQLCILTLFELALFSVISSALMQAILKFHSGSSLSLGTPRLIRYILQGKVLKVVKKCRKSVRWHFHSGMTLLMRLK